MFTQAIRELYQFRGLLWVWSFREIRIRYKQSVLGGIWAVLQPLSTMLIFTLIFGFFVQVPTDGIPYPIFFYSALLPWTFFSSAVASAVPSLINNLNLVTKIYFPREILPIGAVMAAFVDFLIASLLFVVLIVIYRMPIHISILWLPILLVMQIFLTFGIGFLGAALIVSYRDLRFIIPLALQIWMYLSPVVYPLSLVPERFHFLYMLNPMAGVIDSYRRILLGKMPQWEYLVFEMVIIIALFFLGYLVFKRKEALFADVI
jgi:lipopolysaccharide transport system permease protein